MKSSIGIVLFFLLGGFFLTSLLGALERSRKMLGIAGACLVAVVCVIVFLTPVQLPSWRLPLGLGSSGDPTTSTVVTTPTAATVTTTTGPGAVTEGTVIAEPTPIIESTATTESIRITEAASVRP